MIKYTITYDIDLHVALVPRMAHSPIDPITPLHERVAHIAAFCGCLVLVPFVCTFCGNFCWYLLSAPFLGAFSWYILSVSYLFRYLLSV